MKVDDIITLSDDRKYLILDEIEVEGESFIMVAGLKDDEETPNNDYQIFKKKEVDGKYKVVKIPDNQHKADLLNLFTMKTVMEETK
ncbi:MAG: hypothetical protein IJ574_02625 [Bacilli bacterium]|nr:hypothetical protein [Bacilli bacterium]